MPLRVGLHRKVPNKNKVTTSARLLGVMICRAEATPSVDGLLKATKEAWRRLRLPGAVDLQPSCVICDHSQVLRASLLRYFPGATILDCYPHVVCVPYQSTCLPHNPPLLPLS